MKHNYGATFLLILAVVWCNTSLNSSQNERTDKNDLSANNKNRGWKFHGESQNEQRHSPLSQINQENVNELSLAWWIDLPEARGQEATPLVVDGDGALQSRGMVGFSKELSLDEIESIRHYIIDRNRYAKTIGYVSRSSR